MKRFLFVILAICVAAIGRTAGGAPLAEQTLPPFDRLAVAGFADVSLVQGDAESIALEGSIEYLRNLKLDVSDGRLTIENNRARRWWDEVIGDGKAPRITITYRKLTGIGVDGAASVRADRLAADRLAVSASGAASLRIAELEASELTVTGSGALKMEVAGRVATQKVRISGAGDYRAAKLDSQNATVTVSGAGRVVVRVQKTLEVSVTGAGSVDYYGDPKVTQDIRGVGSVSRRGGSD